MQVFKVGAVLCILYRVREELAVFFRVSIINLLAILYRFRVKDCSMFVAIAGLHSTSKHKALCCIVWAFTDMARYQHGCSFLLLAQDLSGQSQLAGLIIKMFFIADRANSKAFFSEKTVYLVGVHIAYGRVTHSTSMVMIE